MLARRSLLSLVAFGSLTSGCRFFRPIDPNAPATRPAPAGAPAPAPTAAPATARPAPAAAAPARSPSRERITDANVAAMVLASNHTDISYARLVPSRAEREDIKKFAERMLTDHVGVNQLVTNLLVKLDVTPEDNTASLDMRDESANKRDIMRELNGYRFDSTYIENEVSYHRKFLTSIDIVLLPSVRNAELKALLTAIRPAVAAHLAHAEQVRADVRAKK